jgi:AraC family transcriptional regulator
VGDLPNLAKVDYVDRVNRAIDHITNHLAEPLSLDDIARVACFSSFHFHRIFRALVGETLAQFIKRVRLERAVYLLSHRPGASLTEIALACGFSSSSDFSRSFRAHYGVPPSLFDVQRFRDARRTALPAARLPAGENPDGFAIAIRALPQRRVAYIRVHQPYEADHVPAAYGRLGDWARRRGLAGGQWLGYQWEDPEIVALDKCRYDVGVEIPDDVHVEPGGEVSVASFPQMKVAELAIAGSIELEMRALDWMFCTWLPNSGWAPDHQPGFEAWNGEPFAHGMTHFEIRLQLPVVDAATPL